MRKRMSTPALLLVCILSFSMGLAASWAGSKERNNRRDERFHGAGFDVVGPDGVSHGYVFVGFDWNGNTLGGWQDAVWFLKAAERTAQDILNGGDPPGTGAF